MARVQLVKERDQLKMLVKCTYEPMLGLCFKWIYKACMYSGSQIICGDMVVSFISSIEINSFIR
jgi:hypothetical protein